MQSVRIAHDLKVFQPGLWKEAVFSGLLILLGDSLPGMQKMIQMNTPREPCEERCAAVSSLERQRVSPSRVGLTRHLSSHLEGSARLSRVLLLALWPGKALRNWCPVLSYIYCLTNDCLIYFAS